MKINSDFDLTNYNSYRIKAKCRRAFFPETEEDIDTIVRKCDSFILLGSGHNVILSKEYYDADFLIIGDSYNSLNIDKFTGVIEAQAGVSMITLSEIARDNGLSGLEVFYDIPSSLGGAVVMNAGASGEEIKDVLVKVRYLDLDDNKIKEINKDEMGFEYRNSFFQRNTGKIILKTWLKLSHKSIPDIRQKMEMIKEQRWAKQPKDLPNAGSVFKRPKGYYVGAIIDELKLKGYTVGGAMISEKHGGFIVNHTMAATGEDILMIISEVQRRVKAKYGFELEIEQRII